MEKFIGEVYGRLTIREIYKKKAGNKGLLYRFVKCDCECGNKTETKLDYLLVGDTLSCGCLYRERSVRREEQKLTRKSWEAMKSRCDNKNKPEYKYYGARGISYESRWSEFSNFLDDMGFRPPGTSIDRVDVRGDYTKDNCRWATPEQQSFNRRDTLKIVDPVSGEEYNTKELSEYAGIPAYLIRARLSRGMNFNEIVENTYGEIWGVEGEVFPDDWMTVPYKDTVIDVNFYSMCGYNTMNSRKLNPHIIKNKGLSFNYENASGKAVYLHTLLAILLFNKHRIAIDKPVVKYADGNRLNFSPENILILSGRESAAYLYAKKKNIEYSGRPKILSFS